MPLNQRRIVWAVCLILGLCDPLHGEEPAHQQKPVQEKTPPRNDLFGHPLPDDALARMGTIRFRHVSKVSSLVYSPDSKTLITGSNDGTVRLWEAATGKEIRRLDGTWVLLTSPDGKIMAGGDGGGHRFWEADTGKTLYTIEGQRRVTFSPDSRLVATVDDHTIRFWDLANGQEFRKRRVSLNRVDSVAFTLDGKMLIAARWNTLYFIETATGKRLREREFQGNPDGLIIAVAPDGKTLGVLGRNLEGVVILEIATGKEIAHFGKNSGQANSLAFSPDSKLLATGYFSHVIYLWDPATGKEVGQLKGRGIADAIAFSPDSKTLAANFAFGRAVNEVKLWDVATRKELFPADAHSGLIYHAVFVPDGKTVATIAEDGPGPRYTIRLWETGNGKELRRFEDIDSPWGSCVLSPDGKLLTSASKEGTILLWDTTTGAKVRPLPGQESVHCVAFSPDGRHLAALSGETICLWETATGKKLRTWTRPDKDNAYSLVWFSPDGKAVLSVQRDLTLRGWEIATEQEIRTLPQSSTREVISSQSFIAHAPDTEMIAVGSQSTVKVWQMATSKVRCSFQTDGNASRVFSLVFSPDGRSLAVAGQDFASGERGQRGEQMIRVWEMATGKERCRFIGHTSAVWALAYSPDSKLLVSGGEDCNALVWDLTGEWT